MKLLIFLVVCPLLSFGQPAPDTTAKKDSVVYVPIFERTDTIPATILYCAENGNMKHLQGFVIYKGFKDQNNKWIEDPRPLQALDRKRKPVSGMIYQVLPPDNKK